MLLKIENSMKNILLFILILCVLQTAAQKEDTVITNEVYTSHFSYALREPLYVVYKLYQGGGNCDRSQFHFTTGGLPNSALPMDYAATGYDEGHLCNAEDEANNCERDGLTFRFYNCVPQTRRLNRGIWKVWETTIRAESKADSLLIICGSIFSNKMTGRLYVPVKCWKVVYSLTTHQLMHCMLFPNDNSDTVETIDIDALKKMVPYTISDIISEPAISN